jgi:hypothetical protein
MKENAVEEILEHLLNKNFIEKNICYVDNELRNNIKSLLNSLDNHALSQIHQGIIAEKLPELLPLLKGITFETIITFCQKSRRGKENISILFEIYKENIKNNEKNFMPVDEENKKKLIIALLSALNYEDLLEFGNPEALMMYNRIVQTSKKLNLNEEELKEILKSNPRFIRKIENPSEDLQMIALLRFDCSIVILNYVSQPSDNIIARLLVQYYCNHEYFKGKFENGVDDNLIEMIIKLNPHIAFRHDINGINEHFGKKINDNQIDLALSINAQLIENLTPEQLTTDRVFKAIVSKPCVVGLLGSKFNYYSSVLAKCARDICNKLPEPERESQLKAIGNYEKKTAKIEEDYLGMISLDEIYTRILNKTE